MAAGRSSTQHIGPDELLVAAKMHFSARFGTAQLADAIDRAETAIRAAVPIAHIIYLEPDLYEADYRDTSATPTTEH